MGGGGVADPEAEDVKLQTSAREQLTGLEAKLEMTLQALTTGSPAAVPALAKPFIDMVLQFLELDLVSLPLEDSRRCSRLCIEFLAQSSTVDVGGLDAAPTLPMLKQLMTEARRRNRAAQLKVRLDEVCSMAAKGLYCAPVAQLVLELALKEDHQGPLHEAGIDLQSFSLRCWQVMNPTLEELSALGLPSDLLLTTGLASWLLCRAYDEKLADLAAWRKRRFENNEKQSRDLTASPPAPEIMEEKLKPRRRGRA
jgi:hypothetical protein